ncbi:MAG: zinc ribbon domain-containing protein, partial [Planctomycetota bacterium]|nr:zinc ribbon domain-containing protein [Planctomycetota bacterium]
SMSQLRSLFILCSVFLSIFIGSFNVSADDALSCPKCDRHFPKEPRYCPSDGAKLKKAQVPQMGCPHCGLVFAKGEKFCPADGFKLKVRKPVARVCNKCQRSFTGGEMFCPFDGQTLAADKNFKEPEVAKKDVVKEPFKEPVRIPAPKVKPVKVKADAVLTRKIVRKFAATPKKTAMVRFKVAKAGTIKARVEYSSDVKIIAYLFAPGFTKPIATKEGFSPLTISSSIDEATILLKKDFEVWVAPRDGEDIFGKVTLSLPTDGFVTEEKEPKAKVDVVKKTAVDPGALLKPVPDPKSLKGVQAAAKKAAASSKVVSLPFSLGSKGTFSHEFKVVANGRIDVRVEFDSGRTLYVKLRDPKKRRDLVEKQGTGPVQLFYQVTGGARTFRLWVIDLEGKASQGKITITKP